MGEEESYHGIFFFSLCCLTCTMTNQIAYQAINPSPSSHRLLISLLAAQPGKTSKPDKKKNYHSRLVVLYSLHLQFLGSRILPTSTTPDPPTQPSPRRSCPNKIQEHFWVNRLRLLAPAAWEINSSSGPTVPRPRRPLPSFLTTAMISLTILILLLSLLSYSLNTIFPDLLTELVHHSLLTPPIHFSNVTELTNKQQLSYGISTPP